MEYLVPNQDFECHNREDLKLHNLSLYQEHGPEIAALEYHRLTVSREGSAGAIVSLFMLSTILCVRLS